MFRKLLASSVLLACAAAARGAPLDVASVSAPAINCVFDADCRITVDDSSAHFVLAGATGDAFLQSRTAPAGEPGTPGEGLIPYEYRLDLRQLVGVTALPCVTRLVLDFGPVAPLDYDGDGSPEDLFVVTGGGLGSVAPSAATQTGDAITIQFNPPVCAGAHPGGGESSFFFGLAAAGTPQATSAELTSSLGETLSLAVRTPAIPGGGPGPLPPLPPPAAPGLCLPGLPISAEVPVCRCLRDPVARELRCGILNPDFLLVRTTPIPLPPGPFAVRWALTPLRPLRGTLTVTDGIPPGFERAQDDRPRLTFELDDVGQTRSQEYKLLPPQGGGALRGIGEVRFDFSAPGGEQGSFHHVFPIGPTLPPDLGDVPSEPLPGPPADPDFGTDACGRAAAQLWREHVERFSATVFGPSVATFRYLKERAKRCRRAGIARGGGGICGDQARVARARCFIEGGTARECLEAARRARELCRRLGLGGPLDAALGGRPFRPRP